MNQSLEKIETSLFEKQIFLNKQIFFIHYVYYIRDSVNNSSVINFFQKPFRQKTVFLFQQCEDWFLLVRNPPKHRYITVCPPYLSGIFQCYSKISEIGLIFEKKCPVRINVSLLTSFSGLHFLSRGILRHQRECFQFHVARPFFH